MKKKLPITKAALLDLVKKGLFDRKKKIVGFGKFKNSSLNILKAVGEGGGKYRKGIDARGISAGRDCGRHTEWIHSGAGFNPALPHCFKVLKNLFS